MPRNLKHHWPTLLTEFDQSGLSQTKFCDERNINPKYFSTKRALFLRKQTASFVKVKILPQKNTQPPQLKLATNHGDLHFDCTVSAIYIASLVRALA